MTVRRRRSDRSGRSKLHSPGRPDSARREDDGGINEANGDRGVGNVCDPELVRPVGRNVLGAVGEDRTIVIAVGRGDETPATLGLQIVLAHQTADLLTVDDDPLMA